MLKPITINTLGNSIVYLALLCCAGLVSPGIIHGVVGVSLTEFTVIFLVALVLFGPEQLPVLARTVGKLTGQLKKTSDSLRREFYNSVYPPGQDIKNSLSGEMHALRSLKAEVLSPPTGALGTSSRPTPSAPAPTQSSETSANEQPETPKTSIA